MIGSSVKLFWFQSESAMVPRRYQNGSIPSSNISRKSAKTQIKVKNPTGSGTGGAATRWGPSSAGGFECQIFAFFVTENVFRPCLLRDKQARRKTFSGAKNVI